MKFLTMELMKTAMDWMTFPKDMEQPSYWMAALFSS